MTYRRVSIVLPAYKQADTIGPVALELQRHVSKVPLQHEFLLVVNGPDDGTLEACQALEHSHAGFRVLQSDPGWGHAIRRGLEEASGDLLAYTNSARTAGEDLALALLYAVAYPGVVIKANRRTRDNFRRRFGSLLYNLECRLLFDLANFDINGTPKVFPREFDRLLALQRADDLIDAEFTVLCRQFGYPMVEVPIASPVATAGFPPPAIAQR